MTRLLKEALAVAAATVVVVLLVALLTACGGDAEPSQQPTERVKPLPNPGQVKS